jgi:hypothetical protein
MSQTPAGCVVMFLLPLQRCKRCSRVLWASNNDTPPACGPSTSSIDVLERTDAVLATTQSIPTHLRPYAPVYHWVSWVHIVPSSDSHANRGRSFAVPRERYGLVSR